MSPAASIRALAGARAAAAPRRCCSTATRRRRGRPTGSSAPSPTAPTTASWPTPWTTRAPSSTPCASAIWPRAPTCRTCITDTRGSLVWARDSKTLFYVRLDENHRPLFVYRHRIGTPSEQDVLVYEERDRGFYVGVDQTQSGKLIVIDAHDHQTSEVYLIDAEAPEGPPRAGGGARARPRVFRRSPRRPAVHPHQLRRRRGLPHLRGAARRSGPSSWREVAPASAGPADPRHRRLRRPSRAAGARGRPAAHRRAPAEPTAASTPSPSTRRPMRSACRAATSSTPPRCASPTRR